MNQPTPRLVPDTAPYAMLTHRIVHAGVVAEATAIASTTDFSLRNMWSQGDVNRYLHLARAVGDELQERGIPLAFAPSVAKMSGRIVSRQEMKAVIRLPQGSRLRRGKRSFSDGTLLSTNDAFVMSAGGCPTVILTGPSLCLVTHAGRDSIIDRERLSGRTPRRPHMSVVGAMMQEARGRGYAPDKLEANILFPLPAEAFAHPLDHPDFGEVNGKIFRYAISMDEGAAYTSGRDMFLDMGCLIEAQFRHEGVDRVTRRHELPIAGSFPHTRHPDPAMRDRRYLVIVHRKA